MGRPVKVNSIYRTQFTPPLALGLRVRRLGARLEIRPWGVLILSYLTGACQIKGQRINEIRLPNWA
jgi:hypothetical protein